MDHSVAGELFDVFDVLKGGLFCHFVGDDFDKGIDDGGGDKVNRHSVDFFCGDFVLIHPVKGVLTVFGVKVADFFLKMFVGTAGCLGEE